MKNIAIAALLATVAAVGALAACGGGTPAPATPDTSASSAAPADSVVRRAGDEQIVDGRPEVRSEASLRKGGLVVFVRDARRRCRGPLTTARRP